jgi:hypothetical protein
MYMNPQFNIVAQTISPASIHRWSFTSFSTKKLFAEVFPSEKLQIRTYTAFLRGLATEELDYCDRT